MTYYIIFYTVYLKILIIKIIYPNYKMIKLKNILNLNFRINLISNGFYCHILHTEN